LLDGYSSDAKIYLNKMVSPYGTKSNSSLHKSKRLPDTIVDICGSGVGVEMLLALLAKITEALLGVVLSIPGKFNTVLALPVVNTIPESIPSNVLGVARKVALAIPGQDNVGFETNTVELFPTNIFTSCNAVLLSEIVICD
jgi:hypothetical protein